MSSAQAAPSILVVEDNPPLRRMLSVTLRSAGYEVLEAADGRGAVAHARRAAPAAVLQDMMLPDIEPRALLDQIRAASRRPALAVVAMSGSDEKLAELRADGQPFSGFLLKPIDSATLLGAVAAHAPAPEASSAPGPGGRVLVVDDDPIQRKLTQLQLERLGFVVSVADDGADALAAAHCAPPDLIVSDVLMPRLDGFELSRAVRADPVLRRVPVVLTSSAYITAADRSLAVRSGAGALIERTPDMEELTDAVRRSISRPATPHAAGLDFPLEHGDRVRAQLDLQARENRQLRERASVSSADLAILAGISGAMSRAAGRTSMLAEALHRCLEAGGVTAAGVWLRDAAGELVEAAHAGEAVGLAELRGYARAWSASDDPAVDLRATPQPDRGTQIHAACLGPEAAPTGLLAFGWDDVAVVETRPAFTRAIAGQLSEALALERAFEELEASRAETISRLALAVASRDGVTAQHTDRVSSLVAMLGRLAGLDPGRIELLRLASQLHDVGKIGVSDTILLKPGPLDPEEFDQMKQHTTIGHRILDGSSVELLQVAATIALTHHERVDGRGYPSGLSGDEIPLEGRIVAVADVFDALTSDRVYRPAMPIGQATAVMAAGRGSHFDPYLLDLLLEAVGDLQQLQAP